MDKQARLEELRDLIVSKTGSAVIGKAIGSDEVKRPLPELRAEYNALKSDVHSEHNERAEQARKAAQDTLSENRKRRVRQLASQSVSALKARRVALKEVIVNAQEELAEYSAAVSFIEAGERLKALLAAATDEEREALAALQEG